jgi:hypothetical protein
MHTHKHKQWSHTYIAPKTQQIARKDMAKERFKHIDKDTQIYTYKDLAINQTTTTMIDIKKDKAPQKENKNPTKTNLDK